MAIKIISGYPVLLDDDVFELINSIGSWWVNGGLVKRCWLYYFVHDRKRRRVDKHSYIHLHRFICGARKGEIVDHINGNTLDNRKSNLRITNSSINAQNTKPHKKKSRLPPGVRLRKETGRYEARISKDKKTYSLGCYVSPELAYKAYQKAEVEKYSGIRRNVFENKKINKNI